MGRNAQRRRLVKAVEKLTSWIGRHPKGPQNPAEYRQLARLRQEAGDLTSMGTVRPATTQS
ncbi:MAG: hypothetical protein ABFE07_29450 [Armatimonadia bacterium]